MIVAASAPEKVAAANAVFVSGGVSAQLSAPKLRMVEPGVNSARHTPLPNAVFAIERRVGRALRYRVAA